MRIAICCLCGVTLKNIKNCALVKCERGHWNALVAVTLRKEASINIEAPRAPHLRLVAAG